MKAWKAGDRFMLGDVDMAQWDPMHEDELRASLLFERGVIDEVAPMDHDAPWAYVKLDNNHPELEPLGYSDNHYFVSLSDLRTEEVTITEDPEFMDMLHA